MLLSSHTMLIIGIGLVLGLIAGFVMHRSDFCMVAIFRDIFLFRSIVKLRSLVLYLAVTASLFELARLAGLLPLYPFPLLTPASMAGVAGGLLFGTGMVMAGGCVVGTLYRVGAGSLLSLVAFIGLIAGSTLYAEFHTWWQSLHAMTTLFGGKITLPLYWDTSPTPLILAFVTTLSLFIGSWFRNKKMHRQLYGRGGIQLWHAALILCGVSLVSYLLVGMPMGITTTYAKTGALLLSVIVPEHLSSLAYFKSQPLTYLSPLTGHPIVGGPGPELDGIALVQYPLLLGIILGGTVSAFSAGAFRFHYRMPARQYFSALAGGVLMGLAARMSPACNLWHLMGGLPILAFSSILFLVGLLPGTWLGSRILNTWVIR